MSTCNSLNAEEKSTFSVQSSYKLNVPEQLIIHSTNLELVNAIGQGEEVIVIHSISGNNYIICMTKGEFGIVYKGYITRNIRLEQMEKDIVAIKTLKGID